jgi:hypothetical protein
MTGVIVLCITKMYKTLDINKTNLTATVEPGVVLQDFNLALAKEGLRTADWQASFWRVTSTSLSLPRLLRGPTSIKEKCLGLEKRV